MNDVREVLSKSVPKVQKETENRNINISISNNSTHLTIAFIAQTLMVTIITVFAIIYFNQDTEPIPATNHNAKEITEFII